MKGIAKAAEGNDGIGDEKDGGRDGGVGLQEGGDQGVADHSHQGVGKDEHHTAQDIKKLAFLLVSTSDLVLCHPLCQRDDRDQNAAQLQGQGKGLLVDIVDS